MSGLRLARIAVRNSMKTQTSTGVVIFTRVIHLIQKRNFGGAVAEKERTPKVVKYRSTKLRMKLMMMKMIRRIRTRERTKSIRGASAVRCWAIQLMSVTEIQISRLRETLKRSLRELLS